MKQTRSFLALVLLALALSASAAQARPAAPAGARASDLVEIVKIEPGIHLDIRYATTNNFMHAILYPEARAFLQRPAAEALVRVHRALAPHGFGVVVFDGYRPWRITKKMWDRSPEAWRKGGYVADPASGSRHNRGCAVDLSMYDLKSGREVEMPSAYDDFTPKAHARSNAGSAQARAHRTLLQKEMLRQGFLILPEEWWHFDYKDWRKYPVLDVDFSEIKAPPAVPAPSSAPRAASPRPTAPPHP